MSYLRFTILSFLLVSSAALFGQHIIPDEKIIDFSVEEIPFREVIILLAEQNDVTIAFQEEIIPGDSIVSLSVRNQRLGRTLDFLLNDHGLKYRIIGNQIVIQKDAFRESDDRITVSGYIRDAYSGESLISANVYLYDKSKGTTTNEYGFYSFTLDKGIRRINYSYLGYNIGIHELSLIHDTVLNVSLDPFYKLNEILIVADRIIKEIQSEEIASVDILPLDKIGSTIPLGGEPDIMRLALSQTGITSGADGFGGLSVRGGSINQNLILFDGIPVYNANHAFGLFSIFNSNLIKSAKIYKGAFPSHYSGRLSSVMDIRTRDGNNQRLSGDFSIGLLTLKGSLEGPIIKDKASYLVSVRRTFVDPWIVTLTESLNDANEEGSSSIYFIDFNGKVNWSLGKKSKMYLSYYSGKDNFRNDKLKKNDSLTEERFNQLTWDSRNILASFRWNFQLSQKSFLNISAYQSNYRFDSFDYDRVEVFEEGILTGAYFDAGFYRSEIEDKGLKLELDFVPGPKHKFKLGVGLIKHKYSPGLLIVDQSDMLVPIEHKITKDELRNSIGDKSILGTEYEFFIEDNIRLGKNTNLNIGYNQMIVTTGKTYFIPQPRLLFSTGTNKYRFNLSWGIMGQYLHTLTNSGLGVPIDVWLPSTDLIEPESSWIFSLGQSINSKKIGTLSAEVFYKNMNKITRYGDEGLIRISSDSDWENLVPIGSGKSYGTELSWNKSTSKTDVQVSYTLSWATRTFDQINNGFEFNYRYDRRHVINIGLIHKLNENIEFSINWEFGSGNPTTIDNGLSYYYTDEEGNQTLVLVFDKIHNDKLPDYHRLDLGVNFYNKYKWGRTKLTLGLYNAYNRQNPFYRDVLVENINNSNQIKYQELTILPILPTFSYNLSF